MITLYIDNTPHLVKEGQNLLQACLSLGFNLPYFCWHPALHSVGACRQCAVKQFKDEMDAKGKIIMSCMTPLTEGMRISVDDPEAKAFRKGVTEWLMLNHPHDCPVCDEGGECHLQDMTVMTGHIHRRNRFPKRTYRNQDLGPFINHEMNRCIQCYRCVRFYRGYAGGRDLNVFSARDQVYFGRHEEGVLESEFSGNLVEVCPTGVFTDKTFKQHPVRKWDLQTAPSVCVHCGIGCNTIAGERDGILRRILNRYHHEINGYFLCDRGRFGYEFVNSEKRIREPMMGAVPTGSVNGPSVIERVAGTLSRSALTIGIGSPRASLESNFMLRSLVGPDHFYSGMSPDEHALITSILAIVQRTGLRPPSLLDVQKCDAVLVLGEDVPNTAPLLHLALRQTARNTQVASAASMKIAPWDDNAARNAGPFERTPMYFATCERTRLDDLAARTYHAAPDRIAALGFAVANELDRESPVPPDVAPEVQSLAREIASIFSQAQRPLIISGTGCMNPGVVHAAANISLALRKQGIAAELLYTVLECNTLGAGLLGGRDLAGLLDGRTGNGHTIDTVIILENDLYRRADPAAVHALLGRTRQVIVLDHLVNPMSSRANILLPTATFAESSGSFVNYEGRAQRFHQVFIPPQDIRAGWQWLRAIMAATGRQDPGLASLRSIMLRLAEEHPVFGPLRDLVDVAHGDSWFMRTPRQSHRFSGRTSMQAHVRLHEPKPPDDADSLLSYSMEGDPAEPPPERINRYWAPGWNSVQALNKFQQEVGGELRGGVPGRHLFEARPAGAVPYFSIMASADRPGGPSPRYDIFRSGELSSCSPSIRERAQTENRKPDHE